MNKILMEIYHKIVKKEKTKRAVRNIYRRLMLIKELMRKDIFVPFAPIEHHYSPFPAMKDIRRTECPPPPPPIVRH
jgi:hypothetical protein